MRKIHVIVCACACSLTCHGINHNIDSLFELSPRYAHVNEISHFILHLVSRPAKAYKWHYCMHSNFQMIIFMKISKTMEHFGN